MQRVRGQRSFADSFEISQSFSKAYFAAATVCIIVLSTFGDAQIKCINSWRSGDTRIVEREFTVNLSNRDPEFKTIIYDSSSHPKYILEIEPGPPAGKGKQVIEWMAELRDYRGNERPNLLKPTRDPEQDSFSAVDYPGWFYLGPPDADSPEKSVWPFLSTRIIKVEKFYCILKVTSYKRKSTDTAAMESIAFHIEFVNEGSSRVRCNKPAAIAGINENLGRPQ